MGVFDDVTLDFCGALDPATVTNLHVELLAPHATVGRKAVVVSYDAPNRRIVLHPTLPMNADATSNVVVDSFNDTTAADLAIAASTGSWATSADITAASTNLKTALTTLRSQAQSLSSNLSTVQIRQDFTKAMINTLTSGADSLTLADSNEEGANLLALQTRQQLSTTALSLASQADQNVLRLFQ